MRVRAIKNALEKNFLSIFFKQVINLNVRSVFAIFGRKRVKNLVFRFLRLFDAPWVNFRIRIDFQANVDTFIFKLKFKFSRLWPVKVKKSVKTRKNPKKAFFWLLDGTPSELKFFKDGFLIYQQFSNETKFQPWTSFFRWYFDY